MIQTQKASSYRTRGDREWPACTGHKSTFCPRGRGSSQDCHSSLHGQCERVGLIPEMDTSTTSRLSWTRSMRKEEAYWHEIEECRLTDIMNVRDVITRYRSSQSDTMARPAGPIPADRDINSISHPHSRVLGFDDAATDAWGRALHRIKTLADTTSKVILIGPGGEETTYPMAPGGKDFRCTNYSVFSRHGPTGPLPDNSTSGPQAGGFV